MTVNSRSALNAYTKQALETEVTSASPHKLVLMLYDGAIASIAMAKAHMEGSHVAAKGVCISKAIAIIEEGLRQGLDKTVGGELAENLDALYEYMSHRLLLSNIHNDPAGLDEVTTLLSQLRDAWMQIGSAASIPASPPVEPVAAAGASYGKA